MHDCLPLRKANRPALLTPTAVVRMEKWYDWWDSICSGEVYMQAPMGNNVNINRTVLRSLVVGFSIGDSERAKTQNEPPT
ncbi:hypothetical protein BST61_g10684 [Cercospora zeina]